jgi:hypothetical protein
VAGRTRLLPLRRRHDLNLQPRGWDAYDLLWTPLSNVVDPPDGMMFPSRLRFFLTYTSHFIISFPLGRPPVVVGWFLSHSKSRATDAIIILDVPDNFALSVRLESAATRPGSVT